MAIRGFVKDLAYTTKVYSSIKKIVVLFFMIPFLLTSCSHFNAVTYFDNTTYTNLTELKQVVTEFYKSFESEKINEEEIKGIRIEILQAYEYEKGKGEKNKETTEQLNKIYEMFQRHVEDRKNNNIWTETHRQNKEKFISIAFDTAIETEKLKNKNIK
ncbi:hypothetical protein ACFL4S_01075 [bacterium]